MRRSRSLRRTFFFFFQAEDGIRDGTVTGVQTCALPIFPHGRRLPRSIACRRSARPSGGPLGPTTLPVGGWSNAEDAPRESPRRTPRRPVPRVFAGPLPATTGPRTTSGQRAPCRTARRRRRFGLLPPDDPEGSR